MIQPRVSCLISCDEIEQSLIMSPGMVLLLFVAYLWIFVLGLVGNIMVMVVVLTRYTDKKEKKIFRIY